MDEREAITRLKDGDISGLEALVEKYYTQAVRTAFLITHERDTAEDIVQTAFLRAYECINKFDDQRPFWPWFLRSVIHDALKAASRHHPISLDDSESLVEAAAIAAASSDNPETLLEINSTRQAIEVALFQLAPPQRAAVVMRYFLEMDGEEMARAMNCPPATARWRLHTGLRRLRTLLHSVYDVGAQHDEGFLRQRRFSPAHQTGTSRDR